MNDLLGQIRRMFARFLDSINPSWRVQRLKDDARDSIVNDINNRKKPPTT